MLRKNASINYFHLVPLLFAVILWSFWLGSITFGAGKKDLAEQVIGADYLLYYAAGQTLRLGSSERLYDRDYQRALQQQSLTEEFNGYYNFNTPPFFALLFQPLSRLPYLVSFALWSVLGFLLLWLSFRFLEIGRPSTPFLWALTWYPVFANLSFGQNSFVSLFLLSSVYWFWKRGLLVSAGLITSLLMYKPQLAIGVLLLWLLRIHCDLRALLGFAAGCAVLALCCFFLMPEASAAYLEFVFHVLPKLDQEPGYQFWKQQTFHAFFLLLFAKNALAAGIATWLCKIVGLLGFVVILRKHKSPEIRFSSAILLMCWLAPHLMVYDLTLLLIPALLLCYHLPHEVKNWKSVFALYWFATAVSGPVIKLQTVYLPSTLHLGQVCFIAVSLTVFRSLYALPDEPS